MRPHSSLPIFAIAPSHRARPHCAISLATASASSRVVRSHDDTEPMDVDLDPPVTLVAFEEEELPTWRVVDGVPFPSHSGKSPRKHALLRSSAPLITSTSTNGHDSSESGSPTAEHQPPPRKRTRTSALLQPPIKPPRSPRVTSLPIRPSRLPRSPSSLLFLPRITKQPVSQKPAEEPFTYAFPTSSSMPTTMPQSALLDLISRLIIPAPLDYSTLTSSIPLPRRRNLFSGGTILLRNVYKTVIYGLALKYSLTGPLQPAQGASHDTPKSPFDIQDALLADRLRCHLTLHGENINNIIIAFEIQKMENHSPVSSQGNTSSPIMSYQHLVSFLLLQKSSLEARSKPPRKVPTCRKPSNLSESYTLD